MKAVNLPFSIPGANNWQSKCFCLFDFSFPLAFCSSSSSPPSILPRFPLPVRCFGWPDWHCCWLDEWPEGGRLSKRLVVQPWTMLLDIQWDHLCWTGQVPSMEELGWTDTRAGWGRLNTSSCWIIMSKAVVWAYWITRIRAPLLNHSLFGQNSQHSPTLFTKKTNTKYLLILETRSAIFLSYTLNWIIIHIYI